MSVYDDFLAEYARIDATFEAARCYRDVLTTALGGTREAAEAAASIVAGSSIKYLDGLGGCAVWDNMADSRGRVAVSLPPVQCPRCSGSGQERLFMHADTCEVCAGDGSVSPETAKAETARREEEIERWK